MGFNIMKYTAVIAAMLIGLSIHPAQSREAQDVLKSPFGLWLTANHRSVIRVEPCSANHKKICGQVYWIIKGGMQQDTKNPDPTRRARPMCGLNVLFDFVQQDPTHWNDGKIYKADEGDTYHGVLQMLPNGTLLVRGYIGMPLFGKSQIWKRVSAKDYPRCKAHLR